MFAKQPLPHIMLLMTKAVNNISLIFIISMTCNLNFVNNHFLLVDISEYFSGN